MPLWRPDAAGRTAQAGRPDRPHCRHGRFCWHVRCSSAAPDRGTWTSV